MDRDLAPDLRVDDEDAGTADDHHVDLGRAAARPAAICEQVVSDAGDWGENPGGLALGTVRDLEAGSALLSVVYLAAEFACMAALAVPRPLRILRPSSWCCPSGDLYGSTVRRPGACGADSSS
ncbi:hypothetical protein [Curtobacterium flaccumfaciens]|uniref:hypothetical protein n=1 Tax=Curtobacterium flaccumfaciens TaxID=2035 RepID=UPI002032858C|nr:hypothetical protein [Curtobacterium flaccumfaciens]